MWKDFFYFSKSERQGIIVLLILIGLVICTGYGLSLYRSMQTPAYDKAFEEEYNSFIASLKEEEVVKGSAWHPGQKDYKDKDAKAPVILSSFDPNTTDSTTFRQMGLPAWMARNILRYRAKGGVFRKPEDFRKIYGLSEEQYATLLPYIYIGHEFQRQDTIRHAPEISSTPDTPPYPKQAKYPAGTVINLNSADTTELKMIPGIGSSIAKRIVNYRRQLGGFYQVSQLREIDLKADELTQWFKIEKGETEQINLNRVSTERLKAHPYFNFYQARVITEHRKKKGNLKRLDQLSFYEEFTPEDLERIKHYVCFE